MKFKILTSIIAVLMLATTTAAMTLDGSCDIKFFGQSTLHDFDGKASCQPFNLTSITKEGVAEMIPPPTIKVLVKEMNTNNTARDKKMKAMFEQDKYPEIQGLFNDLDPMQLLQQIETKAEAPVPFEFDLHIRQSTQRIQAVTRDMAVTPEQISFVVEFPLALSAFQLEPPSVLGMIRVDDQVRVEVHVVLLRQQ
jgi:hypothetical protein